MNITKFFQTKISNTIGISLIALFACLASAAIISTSSAQDFGSPAPEIVPRKPAVEKLISVSLKDQTLTYTEGMTVVGSFKISSGLRGTPTPPGEYTILKKKPVVDYRGADYNFPRTKWNLMFKEKSGGNYYIHGAYWHNNFGRPMSHGCVNVSYANMEGLYNWADEGTKVLIQ